MKRICSILILIVLLLNSSITVLISEAVDAISEALSDENNMQTVQEVALEKYINYDNGEEQGTLIQLKVDVGLQKEEEQDVYLEGMSVAIECPKILEKLPTRVEILGYESSYENGIITIQEEYTERLKYDGNKEYTLILFYDEECYTEQNEERVLNVKVSTEFALEDDETIKGETDPAVEITVTENVGTIISAEYETDAIYNGYINNNIENGTTYDTEYQEKAKIMISNKDLAPTFTITSSNTFGLEEEEIANNGNLLYKKIIFEKSKVEDILGEQGEILILIENEEEEIETLDIINNEIEADENGKYVYAFAEPVENIILEISNIAKEGIIEYTTEKVIKSTLAENVNKINNKINIVGTKTEEVVTTDEETQEEITTENIITLYEADLEKTILIQDAKEKIMLNISKQELTNNVQNELTIIAILQKDSPECKLFENPTIYIEFPEEVEKVILTDTSDPLYDGKLTKTEAVVETDDSGNISIKVALTGKQTTYQTETLSNGTNIILSATVILKQDIESKDSVIKMICNGNTYEQAVKLVDKNETTEGSSTTEETDKNADEGIDKEPVNTDGIKVQTKAIRGDVVLYNNDIVYEQEIVKYEVKITNTTESAIENIKIIGKIADGMTYVDLEEGTFYNEEYQFVPDTSITQKEIEIGTINAGETVEYYYEVKVDELADKEQEKETNTEIKVYTGETEISTYSSSNKIKQAEIAVMLGGFISRAKRSQWTYFAKVSNKSSVEQQNVQVVIPLSENLQVEEIEIWGQEEDKYEKAIEDDCIYVKFNSIKAKNNTEEVVNEEDENVGIEYDENEVVIYITANIVNVEESENNSWNIKTIATATSQSGNIYKSNENRASGYIEAVKVTQESARTGEILKVGEEVIYTFKVENIGNVVSEWGEYTEVNFKAYIPSELQIVSVMYNTNVVSCDNEDGEVKITITPEYRGIKSTDLEEINNNPSSPRFDFDLCVKTGEISTITVKTRVNVISENADLETKAIVTGEYIKTKQSNIIKNSIKVKGSSIEIEDDYNPENPENPNPDTNPDTDPIIPGTKKYTVSGVVWVDENENGQRDTTEQKMSGVEVFLLDSTNNQYLTDENGNIISKVTDNEGKYKFEQVAGSKYCVIFKYNSNDYEITAYQNSDVNSSINSDAIKKEGTLNGKKTFIGMTDIINLDGNKENIDLGLIKNKIFDLKIEKYIQKITVQNGKETKQYNYDNEKIAKIEIPATQIKGSILVVEYKIVVTNVGELVGTVNEIIDEMPATMEFNSELNSNWYKTMGSNLSNTSLANQQIYPGESIETTITLTKTLDETIKTYTNSVKIGISDNTKHIADKNTENDNDKVEVIVSIKTGTSLKYIYTVLGSILFVLIMSVIVILIMKKSANGKGPKLLLFLAILIMVIPSTYFTKADEVDDIINEYGSMQLYFEKVNGIKYFIDGDGKTYNCIDPGKPQCHRWHQYELITTGDLAPQKLGSSETVRGDMVWDQSLNGGLGGYVSTEYATVSTREMESEYCDPNNPIQTRTRIDNLDLYGPFKLVDEDDGAWNLVVTDIVATLEYICGYLKYQDQTYLVKIYKSEGESMYIYRWENWTDEDGEARSGYKYWWDWENEEFRNYYNELQENLSKYIMTKEDGNIISSIPTRGAGASDVQEEFYVGIVIEDPSIFTLTSFGLKYDGGTRYSNYSKSATWRLTYKCVGLAADDTHCVDPNNVQRMQMLLEKDVNVNDIQEFAGGRDYNVYLINSTTINIRKRDADDETIGLPDVEFIIKNNTDDVITYVKENEDSTIEYVSNESEATIFKTDEDGNISVAGLDTVGTYSIIEKYNPHYGYNNIKNQNVEKVLDTNSATITYTAKNKKLVGNLDIEKVNSEDSSKKLSNVSFILLDSTGSKYLRVAVEGKDGFQSGVNNKLIGTVTVTAIEFTTNSDEATIFVTDENGKISIQNLELQAVNNDLNNSSTLNYIIKEIENPNYGHEVDSDYITWVVNGTDINGKSQQRSINIADGKTTSVVVNNEQKYVRISGYVWEDIPRGKDGVRDDIYAIKEDDEAQDKLVPQIKVILHDTSTGKKYETWTDNNGAYLFGSRGTDGIYSEDNILIRNIDKYYIEFEYNGMKYTNVKLNTDLVNGSKAIEGSNRQTFNNKFATIEGNGVAKNEQGETTGIAKTNTGAHYATIKYTQSEEYESQISYTEGRTDVNDYYAVDKYHIGATTSSSGYKLVTTYKPNDEEITNVNFGIYEREQIDLAISTDIEKAEVKLKGYTHTYFYNGRNRYLENGQAFNVKVKFENKYVNDYYRRVYQSAVSWSNLEWNNIDERDKLQIYITYKITADNQSTSLLAKINEIKNYYDSEYTITDIYYMEGTNKISINDAENRTDGTTYQEQGFKSVYIKFPGVIPTDQTPQIYITFKISDEAILGLLNEECMLDSMTEITSYSTYNSAGEIYASVDEDSAPNNAKLEIDDARELIKTTYEDDTDRAPSLGIVPDKQNVISGTIWEDEAIQEILDEKNERLGNGIYDNGESIVYNVKVELIETDEQGNILYENGEPKVGTLYKFTENGASSTNEAKTEKAEVYSDESGNYALEGVIPDEYVIRYTYGEKTYILRNGEKYEEGKTEVIVRDYKSTIIASDEIKKALNIDDSTAEVDGRGNYNWYLIKEKDSSGNVIRYSDAVDDIEKRKELEKTSITNSTINTLMAGTSMTADTATFNVGVEFTDIMGYSSSSEEYDLDENGNPKIDETTGLPNINPNFISEEKYVDFGIILRAKVNITIDKEINHLAIELANGQLLMDGDPRYDEMPNTFSGLDDLVKVELDTELMQGANVRIGYEVTVINNSEVDYDYISDNLTGIAGKKYYYFGETNGTEAVSARVELVVDYLDPELVYDEEKMGEWESVSSAQELFNQGLISEEVRKTLEDEGYSILMTDGFGEGLTAGKSKTLGFEVTKLISAKGDINYTNDVEILQLSGSAARTVYNTTPGNLIPTYPKETDEDSVELIIITPTGGTDTIIYVITAICSLTIVMATVIVIKKKVLR